MSQPVSADQYKAVIAAGTTLVSNQGVNLSRVILPGTFVGSVEFYDSATLTGTAAGNLVYNVGLPLINQYKSIDLRFRTRYGLVVVATGTPTVTYTYDA